MPRFAHNDVLDNGPAYVRTNCNAMVLISSYAFGDSYAVVVPRILATVGMVPTDFVLGTSGSDRQITTAAGKFGAALADGGGDGNHIAFLDTATSKVLWVTEETSLQAVVNGNPVYFPVLTYTSLQPQEP